MGTRGVSQGHVRGHLGCGEGISVGSLPPPLLSIAAPLPFLLRTGATSCYFTSPSTHSIDPTNPTILHTCAPCLHSAITPIHLGLSLGGFIL